jgi:hypothetical protein
MGSEALPGGHYCGEHQGNTLRYAKEGCVVCHLQAEVATLQAEAEGLTTDQIQARADLRLRLRYRPQMKVTDAHKADDLNRADPEVAVAQRRLRLRVENFMVGLYRALPTFTVRRIVNGRTNEPLGEVTPYDAEPETALLRATKLFGAKVGDEIFVGAVNWKD